MRKTAAIVAGLVLTSGLLAGCGDDGDGGDGGASGGSYCDQLRAAKEDINSLTGDGGTPDFAGFDEIIATMRELADDAPDEVADDWDVLTGGLDAITEALDDLGITLEELMTSMTTGQLPEGVTQEDLIAVGEELQELGGDEMEEAGDAISEHAKSECDVDLDETPAP